MANIWRDPIFDRTSSDVAFAIQQIAAWKNSHSHAGEVEVNTDAISVKVDGDAYVGEDALVLESPGNVRIENSVLIMELGVVYDLKGCLNLSDLVRIEDNISYLADKLISYRYPIVVNSKQWVKSDLPNVIDMKRIASNIRNLFIGFATPSECSPIPETMLSYQDINAIEHNLSLLKQMLDIMKDSFIKSGTYKSGATMRLPIRR